MVSAIDATKPTSKHAFTPDVRANFAAARSEIEALQSAVEALQSATSAAGASRLSYNFNTNTTAPPAASTYRLNNADQTAASAIYIDHQTTDNMDASKVFAQLKIGDEVYTQDWTDAAHFHNYFVTAAATNNGNAWTIPVAWDTGAGVIPAGKAVVRLTFAYPVILQAIVTGSRDEPVPIIDATTA